MSEGTVDVMESMLDLIINLTKRVESLEQMMLIHEEALLTKNDTVMVRGFPFDINEFLKKD